MPRGRPRRPEAERFWEKVDVGDCWVWTAANVRGYGVFAVAGGGQMVRAHRWAWEHLVGAIPEGLQIDHLCKVTLCVNPDHLEPVTPKVNVQRSSWAHKSMCVNGHPKTAGTTYIRRSGARECRLCWTDRNRRAWVQRLQDPVVLEGAC